MTTLDKVSISTFVINEHSSMEGGLVGQTALPKWDEYCIEVLFR